MDIDTGCESQNSRQMFRVWLSGAAYAPHVVRTRCPAPGTTQARCNTESPALPSCVPSVVPNVAHVFRSCPPFFPAGEHALRRRDARTSPACFWRRSNLNYRSSSPSALWGCLRCVDVRRRSLPAQRAPRSPTNDPPGEPSPSMLASRLKEAVRHSLLVYRSRPYRASANIDT
jgi:hypothetical protein